MEWAYKWSDKVASGFYSNLLAQGLLKEEDLEPPLGPFTFYFDAFQELSSCRVSSFRPGPIPFTAIVEYSRLYGIEDEEEFLFLIREMDNTLLSLESKKHKGNKNGPKTSSGNSNKGGHKG